MIEKLWRRYSPFIHIGVWIFFAGMAWASISTHQERIERLEMGQGSISGDIREIKESLLWIKDAIRRQ